MSEPENSSHNPNPHILLREDYENAAPEDLAQKIYEAGYLDITHGFPAKNANQFMEAKHILLEKFEISRLPITGIRINDETRIYLLSHENDYGKVTHTTLMKQVG